MSSAPSMWVVPGVLDPQPIGWTIGNKKLGGANQKASPRQSPERPGIQATSADHGSATKIKSI